MEKVKMYKKSNPTDEFIKVKHHGKIYTPDYLVEDILIQGHYIAENINKKHVIDNSCGDGQFMIHIVDLYCRDYLSRSQDLEQLHKELEMYIHAIDIDADELLVCKNRCSEVTKIYGISNVNWDFQNEDALKSTRYIGKMDFVIGNPPYVRVHNLNEDFDKVKSFRFGNYGMTDLYIVFYELGINMLNDTGILTYITPSSFFTSIAGKSLREYCNSNHILESVCDLKHFQPFNSITYTAIICLNKTKKDEEVDYYEFDKNELKPKYISTLTFDDYVINDNYYFSTKEKLGVLKQIICNTQKTDVSIKNGYATLADKIFIKNFDFDSKYIIPAVKASRAKWTTMFYPYDENSKLVSEDELKKDEKMYNYLLPKRDELINRSLDKNSRWYAFGRSQGINDTFKEKVAINALIKSSDDLKAIDVPSGQGVYSGLYIMSNTYSKETIKEALKDKEFGEYVSMLGKYKSGGYYTFSSKDVKAYLDYKLSDWSDINE